MRSFIVLGTNASCFSNALAYPSAPPIDLIFLLLVLLPFPVLMFDFRKKRVWYSFLVDCVLLLILNRSNLFETVFFCCFKTATLVFFAVLKPQQLVRDCILTPPANHFHMPGITPYLAKHNIHSALDPTHSTCPQGYHPPPFHLTSLIHHPRHNYNQGRPSILLAHNTTAPTIANYSFHIQPHMPPSSLQQNCYFLLTQPTISIHSLSIIFHPSSK